MKDRTIKVEISKTIQEQQYEPLKASASIECMLDDDEDYDVAATEARELCRKQVEAELVAWVG